MMLLTTSCSSKRQVSGKHNLAGASVEQRYDAMTETYNDWQSISVPVKVQLEAPMKFSMSGRAYMIKDSLVYVSMKVFGFEVAQMCVTPDSIYCVDKVHKMAVVEPLARITQSTGIGISQLQSMLLGRVFVPGTKNDIVRKKTPFVLSQDTEAGNWTVKVQSGKKFPYECTFIVEDDDNQVQSLVVTVPGHSPVKLDYKKWQEAGIGYMPETMGCDLKVKSKQLKASLHYTPSSMQVEKVSVPRFKSPGSDYKRLDAAKLLESLAGQL